MDRVLSEALARKWPKVFRRSSLPPSQSLLCFGVECGDGWAGIVDAVCEILQSRADEQGRDVAAAVQIKEKFGGLRFYADGGDRVDDLVTGVLAAEFSRRVCEVTGWPGRPCVDAEYRQIHRTLSPAEARRQGYVPLEQRSEHRPLLPALGLTPEGLRERHADLLVGQVDVPRGWVDLADAVLAALVDIDDHPIVQVRFVVEEGGRLLIVTDASDDARVVAAVAWAAAMSTRIDRETGVVSMIPSMDKSER